MEANGESSLQRMSALATESGRPENPTKICTCSPAENVVFVVLISQVPTATGNEDGEAEGDGNGAWEGEGKTAAVAEGVAVEAGVAAEARDGDAGLKVGPPAVIAPVVSSFFSCKHPAKAKATPKNTSKNRKLFINTPSRFFVKKPQTTRNAF